MLSELNTKPSLVYPQLNIDRMGMALSFVPSSQQKYIYHRLRADMHAKALESGVSIDMYYMAPSAHVTMGGLWVTVSLRGKGKVKGGGRSL
jgi:succinate dehydrogenase/fumarate reductase flavoprotein subunit